MQNFVGKVSKLLLPKLTTLVNVQNVVSQVTKLTLR